MKVFWFFAALSLLFFKTCSEDQEVQDPLRQALQLEDPYIRQVMDKVEEHELQIIYTRIERHGDSLVLQDYKFQVDVDNYFYPASTVKFPMAVAALEKLNELDSLNRNVRYYVEGDTVENSFAEDIIKIFTVSDNHANNRLLEFLGQDDLNYRLRRRGVEPVRISHRLGVHSDEVTTRPLVIYLNDSTTAVSRPIENTPPEPLLLKGIKKGRGFYKADSLYAEPFDFKLKNYYPLEAQHSVLKRIIFPTYFPEHKRFGISEEQRKFLLNAMQMLPREAGYDEEEYYDSYCKFFMYGDSQEQIPEHIQIFNKVGFAYGTLTDCAYIRDNLNGAEFMVSATILVNQDRLFNDDAYEYDEVGIPFLATIGRALYDYESTGK
ncbi:serine hydrolase [Lentiprolixibacter aurantiacus]|uniref:Serine hydrolase n=1 Tax=Lentiprolixibacter aurantiacus TaxID=2993939 RepID=A0AAE3MMW5_9FLAO|nr:serine hydrolase [Lentiprolixibacter aurantiacus]MCX2720143.1 serine hydrolase [Lentiprolixibacter aurantiacus]